MGLSLDLVFMVECVFFKMKFCWGVGWFYFNVLGIILRGRCAVSLIHTIFCVLLGGVSVGRCAVYVFG